MHQDVRFEHWDGRLLVGRPALRRAWSAWFEGRDFAFAEEETFIDEQAQKALFRWRLDWSPPLPGRRGAREERRGADVLHFQGGLIAVKLTYCKVPAG